MESLYEQTEVTGYDIEDAKSDAVDNLADIAEITDSEAQTVTEDKNAAPDYEAIIASDVDTLKAAFPELRDICDITDLNNPLRYAALRDLGLSAEEAYLATAKRKTQDTRAHLRSAHGRNAALAAGMMSQHELATARELFPGMSDSELQRLYKRVTK